ncbi:hypothetical protein M1843_19550 [Isoptericola sp. 4D.3]|uniref:Alkaline phosphatase-like protein PglZ C-terminal domain-containing protein n=1 Tax=Isoptericola peretonis TaxID=2918523 RepID=A0ABT0J8X2_9MICO|nr:hypothetical protein [Isoptericola sp. 4D.3]
MAVIRAFRHEVKGYGTRHSTDVDCLYFDFLDGGGDQILQLSTLGSEHRQSQPKVSQTFQIGREGAAELRSILEQTFAGVAGQRAAGLASTNTLDSDPAQADSADAIDRFAARAGLTRIDEIDIAGSAARRRATSHDDRPLLGGTWYLVDFTHLERPSYVDVESDRRSAPAHRRMAVMVNDLSEDLQQYLDGIGVDVVRAADLGLSASVPAPIGRRGGSAPGTSQGLVPELQFMCDTLGVVLSTPNDVWPGYGKAVSLHGGGTAYLNRTNIDVRATPNQVAQWSLAGLGTVRGPQGQYLRVPLGGAPTAQAAGAPIERVAETPSTMAPTYLPSPVPGPAPRAHLAASYPWLEQLFETDLYRDQKSRAGRAAVSDDRVRDVLTALVHLGSSGPIDVVEHEAGMSAGGLRPLVPLLRRLLNADGYETLAFADGILDLDDELLRQQFGLSRASRREGEVR